MFGLGKKKSDPQFDARVAQVNAGHALLTQQDFSHVTTPEQAEAAVAAGELEWFQLIPEQFGGDPAGRVPAPVGTTAHVAPMYALLEDMLRADLELGLDLNVGYVGDSQVAGAVIVSAPRKDGGAAVQTVYPLWAPNA